MINASAKLNNEIAIALRGTLDTKMIDLLVNPDEAKDILQNNIPEYSSSFIAGLHYGKWSFFWKWCWYSRRYTMTSNDYTISGSVPPYFMNDITLNRSFDFRRAGLSVSAAVKNLFNEKYLSVLARPMPGINFEIFVGITPKFGKIFQNPRQ